MLAELRHFNDARRYVAPLLIIGVVFAALGLALTGAISAHANAYWRLDLPIPRSLGFLGAAFLVAAAGFLSAGIMTFVRFRLEQEPLREAPEAVLVAVPDGTGNVTRWRLLLARARPRVVWRTEMLAAWPQALVALLFGALGVAGVVVTWGVTPLAAADPTILEILGGALIVAAFPLLVLERSFAGITAEMLPDAPQLDRLLRVPLTVCLGLGIASALRSLGFAWAIRIEQGLAILVAAIALEVVVRSLALAFMPFAPIEQRRSAADSSVAGLLRFSAPNFQAFNTAVRQQFGIDLSRSWALAFIQRAIAADRGGAGPAWPGALPASPRSASTACRVRTLWLPVAVLGPGLHFHLPWPMGVMRERRARRVHDIPIAISPLGDPVNSREPERRRRSAAAIGRCGSPAAARRRSAVGCVASLRADLSDRQRGASGQQSFQIADADLRVVYRVGLSDAAASISPIGWPIRRSSSCASTGQLLVRFFALHASRTCSGKAARRSPTIFARRCRTNWIALSERHRGDRGGGRGDPSAGRRRIRLPQRAGRRDPGQIADRRAARERDPLHQIGRARGDGGSQQGDRGGLRAGDQAKARASCSMPIARRGSATVRRSCWSGRLERLSTGLAKSEVVVIDHRLKGQNGPTIDLRSFDADRARDGTSFSRPVRITAPKRTRTNPLCHQFQEHNDDARAPSPRSSPPRSRPS